MINAEDQARAIMGGSITSSDVIAYATKSLNHDKASDYLKAVHTELRAQLGYEKEMARLRSCWKDDELESLGRSNGSLEIMVDRMIGMPLLFRGGVSEDLLEG